MHTQRAHFKPYAALGRPHDYSKPLLHVFAARVRIVDVYGRFGVSLLTWLLSGQPQDGQQTLGLLAPARSGALRMRHAWEDRRALRASRSAKWVAKLKQAWDWLTGGPGSR